MPADSRISRIVIRRGLLVLGAMVAVLGPAAPAGAVLSGENGRIVFASGRDGGDAQARLYLRGVVSSSGGGALSGPIVPAGGQYRHPTWSPDRTRIAFANGTANLYDIFILDLAATPSTITPITNTGDGLSADRPAWSPDGTRIAYEAQTVAMSTDRDILVQTVGTAAAPLPLTSAGPLESKPAWSPDSGTIYYGSGDPSANSDIVSEPADGSGTPTLRIPDSGISEFQPSISPDGTKICFTLGTGFDATADVMVADLASPSPINVSDSNTTGDYNCTWSPDGQFIAYVVGTFSTGALVMERADDSSLAPIPLEDSAGNFDGNPDWAPDGRPTCEDDAASTTANTPVTIPLDCTDTGPEYERTPVGETVANGGDPQHGTLGQITPGDPSNATYTPDPDFTGTDSFNYIGFDEFGFGTDQGTITLTVQPGGGGGGGGGGGDDDDCDDPGADEVDVAVDAKKRQRLTGNRLKTKVKVRASEDITAKGKGKARIAGGKTFPLKAAKKAVAENHAKVLRLLVKGSPAKQRRVLRKLERALEKGRKVRANVAVVVRDEDGLCEGKDTEKRTIKIV